MSSSEVLGKVTAFVLRATPQGSEVLLFEHPFAGIQIPAGTLEANELPEAGALREAREETGLSAFTDIRLLGVDDERSPDGKATLANTAPVYSRPHLTSPNWAQLPRGTNVDVIRQQDGFTQVSYEESDRFIDPEYASVHILGWVRDDALTHLKRRHFFALTYSGESAERWPLVVDENRVTLFWAPLRNLPQIVTPQDQWMRFLKAR